MNAKESMLCHECDNVFHKSTAKKSHIRIPVLSGVASASVITPSSSTEKLLLSRDNSSSEAALQGEPSVGEPHPTTAANALLHELNEFCRAPLVKCGMLDVGRNRLCLPKDKVVDELSDQVLFECSHCLVLAGLRGILEDREVKHCNK